MTGASSDQQEIAVPSELHKNGFRLCRNDVVPPSRRWRAARRSYFSA